ncbi:hypothetical protein ACQ4WX_04195 [Streptomyces lasalocidi]
MGAWLARYATGPIDIADDTLVGPAVDSRIVRGSRTGGTAVHRLITALHACQTVIAQCMGAARATSSQPPPYRWTESAYAASSTPPTRCAPSAPASSSSSTPSGHRLLVAERSQKKLHKQHRHLPRRPSASLSTLQSAAAEP